MKRTIYSILFSLALLWACPVFGQLNPESQVYQAQAGISNSEVLISSLGQAPNILVSASGVAYDTLHLEPHATQSGIWVLTFTPKAGVEGSQNFAIKYQGPGFFPGTFRDNYCSIQYDVTSSVVKGADDFYLSDGSAITMDVLANDISDSGDTLSLESLSYIDGGTASVVNGKIEFTLDANTDRGYVQYVTTDDAGTGSHAIACIVKEDSYGALINKSTHNKTSVKLHMDDSSAINISSPNNGDLVQINNLIWMYTPNSNFVGTENIMFEDQDGNETEFEIEVYNKGISTGFVKDDEVFTPINTQATFNVLDNDFVSNHNIFSHSPELTHLGNGVFEYTPDFDFQGDEVFWYKIFTGSGFYTGDIYIHVDDQAPVNSVSYSFDIYQDESLELDYQAPFNSYTFDVASQPSNGTLQILDDTGSVQANCSSIITGEHKIVYTPNSGYNGTDDFDVEYCTDYNNCTIVKITVEVANLTAPSCICYNDCVWPGDANRDGIVTTKDYLYNNLYLGKSGDSRTAVSSIWESQECTNWNFNLENTNVDQKNTDADGDGVTSQSDFDVLDQNFNLINNIISERALILDDLPVTLVPQQASVDSGEWLFLDIVVGNSNTPAINFSGMGLQININPDLIDSANVILNVFDDSWVGKEGPVNGMYKVPYDGRIDVGVSSISNIGPSGQGVIAELGFIVEDDIEGWRLSSQFIKMGILLNNAVMLDTEGNLKKLPEHKVTVEVDTKPQAASLEASISIFPNPASDITNIQSDKYSIDRLEIYDITGKFIQAKSVGNTPNTTLNVSELMDGLYFVKVFTGEQEIVKKLNKVSL